jgi:hypothetical protein
MIHLATDPSLRRAGWRPAPSGRSPVPAQPRPDGAAHAWPFPSRPDATWADPTPAARPQPRPESHGS